MIWNGVSFSSGLGPAKACIIDNWSVNSWLSYDMIKISGVLIIKLLNNEINKVTKWASGYLIKLIIEQLTKCWNSHVNR